MIYQRRLFGVAACAVTLFGLSATANAALSGTACVAPGLANQTAPTTLAAFTAACSGNPGYTFSLPTTNIAASASASPGPFTGAAFVASDGGTILTGAANAALAMSTGGQGCAGGCTSTLVEIVYTLSGNVNQVVTVTHDDGFVVFDQTTSTVLFSDPGPTPVVPTTFNFVASAGNVIDLFYDECCGSPAQLTVNLPMGSSVPEPMSMTLLGTLLAGVGLLYRRKKIA